MDVELTDRFWGPRLDQLRSRTLEVILDRLEEQGAVDNLRRLAGRHDGPRRAMHFSDSDLWKWLEAACTAGRTDLAEPVVDLAVAAQAPDGYLHTHYGTPDGPPRYTDLEFGHEHYCFGHLFEAAVAHHDATGSDRLLAVATGLADHLCDTFGPGRDERTDAHPEVELALCRLAAATGADRYVDQAAWTIEQRLRDAGTTLDDVALGGHAVRALYLASGIAEVALATGDERWTRAALRLHRSMLAEHAYPTGAVGGRWLGESVGRPFEQPDAAAYAESCAAVAALQLSWRIWALAASPEALDHAELLLFNAVPCGVGPDGDTWFYSQPQAVDAVAEDPNPWVYGFDYGQAMLREWFPARRHRWFDVPCCPPNLARAFAAVPDHVAQAGPDGDLLVHLPVAARIRGGGWDVEVHGDLLGDGRLRLDVHRAPARGQVRVRRPAWAGGHGHEVPGPDGTVDLGTGWEWWTTDHRVEGAGSTVHLRRGPVVHCLVGVDHPGVDLRDLFVDPSLAPGHAVSARAPLDRLHRPWPGHPGAGTAVDARFVPYCEWADRGPTTMRTRFGI